MEEKLEVGEKRAKVQNKHKDRHTVFCTRKNEPKHKAKQAKTRSKTRTQG
jgi:hypothetical protein